MKITKERERLFNGWQALKKACSLYHQKYSKGPGAAAVCICGSGGGGSEACGMLGEIRNFFRYTPERGDEVEINKFLDRMDEIGRET